MEQINSKSSLTRLLGNRRKAATWCVYLVAFIALNWVYSIGESMDQEVRLRTEKMQTGNAYPVDDNDLVVDCSSFVSGWPIKYYTRVDYGGLPSLHSFSFYRFAANIGSWMIIAACVVMYFRLTQEKSEAGPSEAPMKVGQLKLLDLFVIMSLIACAFGYWQVFKSQQQFDEQLAKRVREAGGVAELQVVAPKVLRLVLPEGFLAVFNRLTGATLESPSNEILDAVLSVPELRSLRLGGGDYELSKLRKLHTLPYLRELRVAGRELNGDAIAAIGSCKQLISLNLMRTNISNEGLEAISDLPRLRSMNLVHTAVSFAKIKQLGCSRTVRSLFLPHPGRIAPVDLQAGDKVCQRHSIQGWPELDVLRCIEHDEIENSNCVQLQISDCPKLTKIGLDVFQRFDLELSQLESLSEVTAESPQWTTRLLPTEKVQSEISVRNLELRHLPKLTEIRVSGKGLQRIRLESDELQKLYIRTSYLRPSIMSVTGNTLRQLKYDDEINPSIRQGWIDQIGMNAGPAKVDLSWLPLNGLDLTPLQNNHGLRELNLSHSLVNEEQLMQLAGSPTLERVILLGTNVSDSKLAKVLSKLTKLKELRTNSPNTRRLNLELVENIERIFETQGPRDLDSIRLVSMPNLKEALEIRSPLQRCALVGIPSVRGLAFQAALPKNTKIEGLRDLQFFSAGGRTVSDKIVEQVLACKGLKHLTLAYATSVSPETLARIADLEELQFLSLPGCNIDDNFLRSLGKLKKLKGIVLDDTPISDSGLEGLELRQASHFSVSRTSVTDRVVQKFLADPTLTKIGLAGLKISTPTVEKIVQCTGLEELDLSETTLEPSAWAAFSKYDTVKNSLIVLRNAKIDFKIIRQLMSVNLNLRMDVTNASDRVTEEDSYSLVQTFNSSMSPTDERMVDTWHPRALFTYFGFEDLDEIALRGQQSNASSASRMAGEIVTIFFSPAWK